MPAAALAAVRAVFGDDALPEVRAVLRRPLAHQDPAATVLALRTLPWRKPHNLGGLFVDLIRAALKGEQLVDRDAERARTRDAEAAERNRALVGVDLSGLDDGQLADELDLLDSLIAATEEHDKIKHRGYVAERARVQAAVDLRPGAVAELARRRRRRLRRSTDPFVAPDRMSDQQLADYAVELDKRLARLPEGPRREAFERTREVVEQALVDRPRAARLVAACTESYALTGSPKEVDELLWQGLAEIGAKLGDV